MSKIEYPRPAGLLHNVAFSQVVSAQAHVRSTRPDKSRSTSAASSSAVEIWPNRRGKRCVTSDWRSRPPAQRIATS